MKRCEACGAEWWLTLKVEGCVPMVMCRADAFLYVQELEKSAVPGSMMAGLVGYLKPLLGNRHQEPFIVRVRVAGPDSSIGACRPGGSEARERQSSRLSRRSTSSGAL